MTKDLERLTAKFVHLGEIDRLRRLEMLETRVAMLADVIDQGAAWLDRISSEDGTGHSDLAHALEKMKHRAFTESECPAVREADTAVDKETCPVCGAVYRRG